MVTWFAVIFQLVLIVRGGHVLEETAVPPLATRLARFVSYFTILSNLLVALTTTPLALGRPTTSRLWRVLRLDAVVGIAVTGLVHWLFLRPLLHLHGTDYAADKLLHVVVPLLAVVGWLAFGPRGAADRSLLLPSLIYPLGWLGLTLVRGGITGWYPYPFLDMGTHGYGTVLVNCLLVAVLLLALTAGGHRSGPAAARCPGDRDTVTGGRHTGHVGLTLVAVDFTQEIKDLRATMTTVREVTDLTTLKARIDDLEAQASVPNLWDDPDKAQGVTSALSRAKTDYDRVVDMDARIDDLETLVEMGTEDGGDAATMAEAETELASVRKAVGDLEIRTLLAGEFDQRAAVVTIRSGAGGVDAADFAEMLLRMYLRWAERHGYPTKVMDTSYAEEAGLKSATFEVNVPYAFGNLSVEGGTHRLVRISPFDNQGRRQTSFAAVEVIPLIEQTDSIEIPDNEIKVDVFRSSGPGGQSVNTTDSAVRMTHLPTGIVVSMQNEKSQIQNRAAALRVLSSRLLLMKKAEEAATRKEMAGDVKASWGDQMRSYVLNPYQMVKDLRTDFETGNPTAVFDGDIDGFLEAGIRWQIAQRKAED